VIRSALCSHGNENIEYIWRCIQIIFILMLDKNS
jgi:hypothetical protein